MAETHFSDPMPELAAPAPMALRLRAAGRRSAATLLAPAVCVLLAALTRATLPSAPGYDPFSWIVWGGELAHQLIGPHQPFLTSGGPSWKPLPVAFTTLFGLFGAAAPPLWVVCARASGLLGLWIAYVLGARLGRSERWPPAGPVAGVLSAAACVLTFRWFQFMFRATSEPMVLAATLLAIERHLAGRRLSAFAAGVALALLRPEATPLVALYGVWLLVTGSSTRTRMLVVAGLLLIPAAWIVPPWLSTDAPLLASRHARDFDGHLGAHPLGMVLHRALTLTSWPVLGAAAVTAVLAVRRRERLTLVLAAGCLAYVAIVAAMALDHYPGLERFMLPAAALVSVLAAVGVTRIAEAAGGGRRSAFVAAALVTVAVPLLTARAGSLGGAVASSRIATRIVDEARDAITHGGGSQRMLPCATSRVAVNHTLQPMLAWEMQVPLQAMLPVTAREGSLRRPALLLDAPDKQVTGDAPTALGHRLRARTLRRFDGWRVARVTRPGDGAANVCVGR